MSAKDKAPRRSGTTTGLMLAGAVCVLALPSAVLAFSSSFDQPPSAPAQASGAADSELASFAPADGPVPVRSLAKGHVFRFTPAGTQTRPDRSVTVAVRVDPQTAHAITVRANRLALAPAPGTVPLGIAPTGFTLGVSRGYQSFVQTLIPAGDLHSIDMPDLASFKSRGGAQAGPSRFSPRITLDEKQAAGRAPRTFSGDTEDRVDVGGSYRLTRNLDVTAGVRYSQERDRLAPLTDGKQDNQAVYVGTQFRF